MIRMNFRIGAKLGISAGIGVLLIAGLIANEQLSNGTIAQATTAADKQQVVQADALGVTLGVRGMQLANRDLRMAHTAAETDKALQEMHARLADIEKSADAAIELTVLPDQRQRLTRAKALAHDFAAAAVDIAAAHKDVLKSEVDQVEIAAKWTTMLDALRGSPAMAAATDRHGVETEVHNANVALTDGTIRFWRYRTTADPALAQETFRDVDRSTGALGRARALAGNKTVTDGIDELAGVVAAFRAMATATVKSVELQARIIKERSVPARAEMGEIITKAVAVASQRTEDSKADAAAAMIRTSRVGLAIGLLVVVVLIGSAVFSVFSIARPIRRIGDVLLELANGNKAVEIPYAERGDEVGDNARAAKTFKDNLLRIEAMEAEQKVAEARATEVRKADMHRLADGFEAAVGGIVASVSVASSQLEAAARTLTRTAATTQQLSTVVAGASEEAASNVQAVASASEQLTASVNEISRQVQESSRIASEAVEQAGRTDARINELSQAAARIGDVVKLITAIAEQTNLLALNATIEAARAGDAGRGFAVVAQEVKALAAQTAKATDEISTQIAGMQSATQVSVSAIKEIGSTIGLISEIATTIASAVEEQGAATQEIARNVHQAAAGTTQVASNIVEVNEGAGETGTASNQVLVSAQTLAAEGSKLKIEVDKFLMTVRAA